DQGVVVGSTVEDDIARPADNRQPAGEADAGAIAVDQGLHLVSSAQVLPGKPDLIAGNAVADQQVITRPVEGHVGGREPRAQQQLGVASGSIDGVLAAARIVGIGDRQRAGQADARAVAVHQGLDLVSGIVVLPGNPDLIAGNAVADQQVITRRVEGHVGGGKPRAQPDRVVAAGLVDRVRAVAGIVDVGVIAPIAAERIAANPALQCVGVNGAVEDVVARATDNRKAAGKTHRAAVAENQVLDFVGCNTEIQTDVLALHRDLITGNAVLDQQVITRHLERHTATQQPTPHPPHTTTPYTLDDIAAVALIEHVDIVAVAAVERIVARSALQGVAETG